MRAGRRSWAVASLSLAVAACGGGSGGGSLASLSGDFVAYVADAETPGVFEAFVADGTGAHHRKVAGPSVAGGDVYGVEWSPDRTRLAVLGDLETDGKAELYLVDPAAALPSLTKVSGSGAQAGVGGVAKFAWAPNGARIAFTKAQDVAGHYDLFTVLTGGAAAIVKVSATITAVGADVGVNDFQWKPGGNNLAYTGDLAVDNTFHLFVVGANGSGHQQCNVPVGNPVDDDIMGYAWASDGSRLAFGYKENGAGSGTLLFSCLPSGLGLVKLSPLPNVNRSIVAWRWAPDGSRLLFTADAVVAGREDLYVVAPDGAGGPTPLVAAGATEDVTFPGWSPDATRIAYTLVDNTALVSTLRVVPASGGAPTLVATAPPGGSGDFIGSYGWSPDGSTIAYTTVFQSGQPHHYELHRVAPDGSGHLLLDVSPGDHSESIWGWSPDSARIAYVDVDFTPGGHGADARVVDRVGGTPRVLSDVPYIVNQTASATDFAWTSDGSFLLFRAGDPGAVAPTTPLRLWIAGAQATSATDLIAWAPGTTAVTQYRLK